MDFFADKWHQDLGNNFHLWTSRSQDGWLVITVRRIYKSSTGLYSPAKPGISLSLNNYKKILENRTTIQALAGTDEHMTILLTKWMKLFVSKNGIVLATVDESDGIVTDKSVGLTPAMWVQMFTECEAIITSMPNKINDANEQLVEDAVKYLEVINANAQQPFFPSDDDSLSSDLEILPDIEDKLKRKKNVNVENGCLVEAKLKSYEGCIDLRNFLENNWKSIEKFRKQYQIEEKQQKIDIYVKIKLKRFTNNDWEYITWYRHSGYVSVHDEDYKETIIQRLCLALDDFNELGSNWIVDQINEMGMFVNNYDPLLRRQIVGSGDIDLPLKLKCKKAVLNIKNSGGECFLISLIAALKHLQFVGRRKIQTSTYIQYRYMFNMDNIVIPFNLKSFDRFHSQNKKYAVNILEWIDEKVKLVRRPSYSQYENRIIINILYLNVKGNGHFLPITNLNRLMNGSGRLAHTRFWCCKCLLNFFTREKLKVHYVKCFNSKEKSLTPPKDIQFKFINQSKSIDPSHLIFCDFESIIETGSSRHIPIAVGYMRVSPYEKDVYHSYSGLDCVEWFLHSMKLELDYVQTWLHKHTKKNHDLSADEETEFNNSNNCYACGKSVSVKDRVREHDHLTGKFRGMACKQCNSKLRLQYRSLKVIIHNLKNYDSHIICKYGLSKEPNSNVHVIANNSEKYITFSVDFFHENYSTFRLQFIDSYQHLNASLADLFQNIPKDKRIITRRLKNEFVSLTDEIIMQKGIFPYEYLNHVDKLKETALPPIEKFYNNLTYSKCSKTDYQLAQKAWNQFNCTNLNDYMLAYLSLDVHMLADVFLQYCSVCKDYYGLHAANYITLPSLTLDAALKSSKICLELLLDVQMIYDFKDAIHVNNLYGQAMTWKLPKSNFHYVNEFDFENTDPDGEIGYFFIVDLEYPHQIHDDTADFPLAPEHMLIDDSLLTDFMNGFTNKERPSEKLLLNQFDKVEYKVFYPLLKFYLKLGMKIKKIHRIIAFNQESFFKQYIEFNSKMRAKATSNFDKSFFKLLNNSLFGKCCENVAKRMNFKLCTSKRQLEKVLAHPGIQTSKIFSEHLTGHTIQLKMRPSLPGVKLLASDTDSFFLEILNLNVDSIMNKLSDYLDTSNYEASNKYFSNRNKAKLGFIKDETCGYSILEAVFMKPKAYSLLTENSKYNKKTCKGISRHSFKNITHDDYLKTYMTYKEKFVNNRRIGSDHHEIYTFEENKKALSTYDNKRAWIAKNISLPYGHYFLAQTRPKTKQIFPSKILE
ncbi:hypothetical protein GQR58_006038 [Nymphon striatum]|nr:hypothetical protein GQR58_006038 [Nymphon striatum]